MVRYNRVECLTHPVCAAFLRMKWMGYGVVIHMLNLLLYVIFLASLTAFVTSTHLMPTPSTRHHGPGRSDVAALASNNDTMEGNVADDVSNDVDLHTSLYHEGGFKHVEVRLPFIIKIAAACTV